MNNFVADSESAIRLAIFFTVLLILIIFESLFPRRQLIYARPRRWRVNFGLGILNSLLVALILPVAAVGAAFLAEERGWGLFHWLNFPAWLSAVSFLLLFDLTIYLQHRLFHKIPWLWRLHRMHHTDLDYDLSTGIRFHPLSILLSSLIKLLLIFLLGPAAVVVITAELLLNATSMFNHSNVYLPPRLDKYLRYILVTPDMHRIHHSVEVSEHNRNFGFNFPWWDRLFGTYLDQPELEQTQLHIGLWGFLDSSSLRLMSLLLQPFRPSKGSDNA